MNMMQLIVTWLCVTPVGGLAPVPKMTDPPIISELRRDAFRHESSWRGLSSDERADLKKSLEPFAWAGENPLLRWRAQFALARMGDRDAPTDADMTEGDTALDVAAHWVENHLDDPLVKELLKHGLTRVSVTPNAPMSGKFLVGFEHVRSEPFDPKGPHSPDFIVHGGVYTTAVPSRREVVGPLVKWGSFDR